VSNHPKFGTNPGLHPKRYRGAVCLTKVIIVPRARTEESEPRQVQLAPKSAGKSERRSKTRYEMELGVRFFPPGLSTRFWAAGKTVNVSSGGLLIVSPCQVSERTELQLMLEWPSKLDGRIPLQLVVRGCVVRSEPSMFAVALRSHHFRTMKRDRAQPGPAVYVSVGKSNASR